jgi:hypothetical protein
MRFEWLCLLAGILSFASLDGVVAQNRSAEFIESSSPLPGGGRVTSRTFPNASVQTVTTGETPIINSSALTPTGNSNSVLEPSNNQQAAQPVVSGGAYQGYPYPTYTTSPRSIVLHPPIRATAPQYNSIPYQIPTLGITNTITNRENKSFSATPCNAQSAMRPPIGSSPVVPPQSTNPAATGAVAPNPCTPCSACTTGSAATQQSRFFNAAADPQLAIQSTGCYYPPVEATGAYQPVFRMANLPPGVYVGEGMFGKPQTYRDGQPVRNLFRYIVP